MSKILEEYGEKMYQEGMRKAAIKIATRMLVDGKLRLEEIVEYTGLEMAEVEELARKMSTRECEEIKKKNKKTTPGMVWKRRKIKKKSVEHTRYGVKKKR